MPCLYVKNFSIISFVAEKKYFKIKGRVQGIGFRFFVKSLALKLNLNGWVRNMENPDEVEGVVEGEKENILLFFKDLKTGHSMAVINKVEISDFYEDVGKEFTIRR